MRQAIQINSYLFFPSVKGYIPVTGNIFIAVSESGNFFVKRIIDNNGNTTWYETNIY